MSVMNKLVGKAYLERQFRRFHKLVMKAQILDPLRAAVDNKVDPVEDHALSKNDLSDELYDKLVDLENYDDTQAQHDIRANNRALTRLMSDINTVGSVQNTVETRAQEILDGAPEEFDTVKEISEWIDEHDPVAARMNYDIEQNTENLDDLKERWDNYTPLTNEDENIDFTNDTSFYVNDWIRVVPNSLVFTSDGILTDNPEDYTVDLIQSRTTADGTVYNSEPLTVRLDNLELLDFIVSVTYNRSVKSVTVNISGTCAASTTYTTGKIDTVIFELHQWLHLSSDSEFDPTNVVVNDTTGYRDYYDCTVSKVVLSIETDAKGTVSELSEDEYSLSELMSLGLDVDVDIIQGSSHSGKYCIQSNITVRGVSACSSDAYDNSNQSKQFTVYNNAYYTPSASDLGSVSKANAITWASGS